MSDKLKLWEVISIGIGGMVGGGIFAVLGLAVSLSKGSTPVSFLLAGIIALLTSYSYAKLSSTFKDRGGTVRYINEGFGKNIFSGGINNLLWFSYIIMLSLYASAFGSYAPNLIELSGDRKFDFHLFASLIVILATLINYFSIQVVGKIESFAVIIKLIILTGFILIGIYGLSGNPNLPQLYPENWENTVQIISGGMVIFVAYEGFELIANATPDIENPKANISKAYFISVIFVILLYIIIALVTVGSLPFDKIAEAQDYVLAEAAKPMLGKTGFTIITIAALISTFSAINASLYGGSRVSYELAKDDELPHEFTSKLWNQPIGLLITAVSTLLLSNTLDIQSISTAGSTGFLIIFTLINLTGFKLRKKIKALPIIPLTAFILTFASLLILINQQFRDNKNSVFIAMGIVAICFIIEYLYKRNEKHSMSGR